MTPRFQEFAAEVTENAIEELRGFEAQRNEMTERHREERRALKVSQDERWQTETAERSARFSSGLKGLWDRVTGRHARIARENDLSAQRSMLRDRAKQDELKERQRLRREKLQEHLRAQKPIHSAARQALRANGGLCGDEQRTGIRTR